MRFFSLVLHCMAQRSPVFWTWKDLIIFFFPRRHQAGNSPRSSKLKLADVVWCWTLLLVCMYYRAHHHTHSNPNLVSRDIDQSCTWILEKHHYVRCMMKRWERNIMAFDLELICTLFKNSWGPWYSDLKISSFTIRNYWCYVFNLTTK